MKSFKILLLYNNRTHMTINKKENIEYNILFWTGLNSCIDNNQKRQTGPNWDITCHIQYNLSVDFTKRPIFMIQIHATT
jgi:hypothetical protein